MADLSSNGNPNVEFALKIFSEHGDFIQQVIKQKVSNHALAEDIFQDFFLTLISMPIPKNIQNIRGYLYYVISKDIVDSIRRTTRYQQHLKKYSGYCAENRKLESEPSPVIDGDELEKMFQAIETNLSPQESRAIEYRYKLGFDSKEAAQKMGIKTRSLQRYIAVGLTKIRKVMSFGEWALP